MVAASCFQRKLSRCLAHGRIGGILVELVGRVRATSKKGEKVALIAEALRVCHGNQSEAARRLEVSRVTLLDKMKRQVSGMATLVTNVLDVSRMRLTSMRLDLHQVDLAELVRDAAARRGLPRSPAMSEKSAG